MSVEGLLGKKLGMVQVIQDDGDKEWTRLSSAPYKHIRLATGARSWHFINATN